MDLPLTINKLHQDLKQKKYCVEELTKNHLNIISKQNKNINAFITISSDYAIKKSKELDVLIKKDTDAFNKYPLLGATVAYKDMFLTKGIKTTAGSKVLENYVPQYSSTVVKNIEGAGGVTIGKTNQDAWAHGASGENSDFGNTKNPWNFNFVPGGSSSGSAASIASNFSLISTGTDTCGSIRLPANFCYTYGFKPTYGSVSRYGIVSMASSLDSVGHFARSVSDVKRIFDVTKGVDNKDSTLIDKSRKKNKNIVIGVPEEFFEKGVDREIQKNVQDAIDVFKKINIKIKKVNLKLTKYAVPVYYVIQPAEVSSNLARYDGIRYGNKRDMFSDEAKRRIMLGTFVLSSGYYDSYYKKAMQVRTKIIQELNSVFKEVDALISPVTSTLPFKLGERTKDPLKMYLTDIFTATASLSGTPALAIPFNFSKNGLPMGFQLMGRAFEENTLFNLAQLFENKVNYIPRIVKF